MKDFNEVQRYLWEDDNYSEHGGGYLYTSDNGQYVEYEDYKELLKQYSELSYRLKGLDK